MTCASKLLKKKVKRNMRIEEKLLVCLVAPQKKKYKKRIK